MKQWKGVNRRKQNSGHTYIHRNCDYYYYYCTMHIMFSGSIHEYPSLIPLSPILPHNDQRVCTEFTVPKCVCRLGGQRTNMEIRVRNRLMCTYASRPILLPYLSANEPQTHCITFTSSKEENEKVLFKSKQTSEKLYYYYRFFSFFLSLCLLFFSVSAYSVSQIFSKS